MCVNDPKGWCQPQTPQNRVDGPLRRREETLTTRSCCQEQRWRIPREQLGRRTGLRHHEAPRRRGCAWPWSDSDRLGLPRRTGRREGTAPAQRPRRSALLGNLAWTFPALRSSIPLLPLQPGQQVQDRTSPLLPPSSSCNACSESKPSTGGLSCISRR